MTRFLRTSRLNRPRTVTIVLLATAGLIVAALVGVAVARTFTLNIAKRATVRNAISGKTVTENIVVTASGLAVYDLTGDSQRHPECTKGNGCFAFWPPVKVSSPRSLSKAPGITGKLGTWHRNGFFQVTLAGHPLYRFFMDTRAHHATGEALRSFGGVWHVIKPTTTRPITTTTTTTSSSSSSSSSSSTSSTMCLYPPC